MRKVTLFKLSYGSIIPQTVFCKYSELGVSIVDLGARIEIVSDLMTLLNFVHELGKAGYYVVCEKVEDTIKSLTTEKWV